MRLPEPTAPSWGVSLYSALLWLALPGIVVYHLYRSWSRGRKPALAERFGFIPADRLSRLDGGNVIWVHTVSVGETIAATTLLKALKQRYPERKILCTTGTETGRGVAEKMAFVDGVCYFPFDYGFAVGKALARIRPSLVVIVETEIWPNFLRVAREKGIPVVLANGRISDRSYPRYYRLRWFFRQVLDNFTALCMQTPTDAERIEAVGASPQRVHVGRNLKYDIPAVEVTPERRATLAATYLLPSNATILTAGSTHAGEEEVVIAAYGDLLVDRPDLFLILVPRHPERAGEVGALLRKEGMTYRLRSSLRESNDPFAPGQVLLVDTVGELMALYEVSDLVFVGGSLVPTGGHNVLEPVSRGVPVVYGRHMENFREIDELVRRAGCGIQVADEAGLVQVFRELLADRERRSDMGRRGSRLIVDNSGSVDRHLAVMAPFLERS